MTMGENLDAGLSPSGKFPPPEETFGPMHG